MTDPLLWKSSKDHMPPTDTPIEVRLYGRKDMFKWGVKLRQETHGYVWRFPSGQFAGWFSEQDTWRG